MSTAAKNAATPASGGAMAPQTNTTAPILLQATLKKRNSKGNMWVSRHFILHPTSLEYYVKQHDTVPKSVVPITHLTEVSKVTTDASRRHSHFILKITTPLVDSSTTTDALSSTHIASRGSAGSVGAKIAAVTLGGVVIGTMTAGVGLLAGLVVLGISAAATGSSAALFKDNHNSMDAYQRTVLIGFNSFEEAECWMNTLNNQILRLGESLSPSAHLKLRLAAAAHAHALTPEGKRAYMLAADRLREVEGWLSNTQWNVSCVHHGVRLLSPTLTQTPTKSSVTHPVMRINMRIEAPRAATFSSLINFSGALQTGIIQSVRVITSYDETADIIHMKLHPMYISPSWTSPRDFCLFRYWRANADGSFVLCLDSTEHSECPLVPGYVRGTLHAAYTISSNKTVRNHNGATIVTHDDEDDCMVTLVAQLDPRGWVLHSQHHIFLKEFMLHLLDVRDALDVDRFAAVRFDPIVDESSLIDGGNTADEDCAPPGEVATIANTPSPALMQKMWSEPEASSFKVRGASYMVDGKKVNSAEAMFKLLALDLFISDEHLYNIGSHPKNRVRLAKERGDKTWVFIVNLIIPPNTCFVSYFEGNREAIDADTPFGRVARPFFDGTDDDFRNNRFKIIPKITEGNMIVKMAVKDTPALIGTKLTQTYYRGDNYFEVDVDVGSSSVARNICGVAMGYAKALVVDIGVVFQGNEAEELPEVLVGSTRYNHVDVTTGRRL